MTLKNFFKENPKAAVGFSGGIDSAYLLYQGIKLGADIQPVYVKTVFQPQFELDDAESFCRELGIELRKISLDLSQGDPRIFQNGPQRCYYCKTAIFSKIAQWTEEQGYDLVLDGTNASDDSIDRPGMRALQDLGVCSPLRDCALTKDVIREDARKVGIKLWDKPSYACLATRIPTGRPITQELLTKVEEAEDELKSLGFSDFRVRIIDNGAKIQLPQMQMSMALEKREQILDNLSGFPNVFLDLHSR